MLGALAPDSADQTSRTKTLSFLIMFRAAITDFPSVENASAFLSRIHPAEWLKTPLESSSSRKVLPALKSQRRIPSRVSTAKRSAASLKAKGGELLGISAIISPVELFRMRTAPCDFAAKNFPSGENASGAE